MENKDYDQPFPVLEQPELEIVQVEFETDHSKLMRAFQKINQKLDRLIEKKKNK